MLPCHILMWHFIREYNLLLYRSGREYNFIPCPCSSSSSSLLCTHSLHMHSIHTFCLCKTARVSTLQLHSLEPLLRGGWTRWHWTHWTEKPLIWQECRAALFCLCGLDFKEVNKDNIIMYVFTHVIIIDHLASRRLGLPQVVMDWGADITPTNT